MATRRSCRRPRDETLFAGAAAHYDRGLLPNAPGLADAFEQALALDGRGRLLDVGCGPGTVTLPLAGLFQEVVGLDADAGMVQEAQRHDGAVGFEHPSDDPGNG